MQEDVEALSWELRWQAEPSLAELQPLAVLKGILVNPPGLAGDLPPLAAPLAVGLSCPLLRLELDVQPLDGAGDARQLAEVTVTETQEWSLQACMLQIRTKQ